jgi:hypothetical protein
VQFSSEFCRLSPTGEMTADPVAQSIGAAKDFVHSEKFFLIFQNIVL